MISDYQYFTYDSMEMASRRLSQAEGLIDARPSSQHRHHVPDRPPLVNGTGGLFQRARMVCHCLLAETR